MDKNVFLRKNIFSILLLLSMACNALDSNKLISPIEGNIYFKVWENYLHSDEEQKPKIEIVLKTEKKYPHTGHFLITNFTRHGNNINIVIDGVEDMQCGGDAFDSAYWRKFLDLTTGKYNISFVNGKTRMRDIDSYKLHIDNNFIKLESNRKSYTIPEYDKYCRYPENTFAYLFGSLTEDSHLNANFIDSLKTIIDIEQFTFPDDFKTPYPSASSGHYYDAPAQFYKYKNENDFDVAGKFLEDYSMKYMSQYQGMRIRLISWNNKVFKS